VRVDEKVTEGPENAKYGNGNGVIRDGVYGEDEGVEIVALKWDHWIFGRVPFAILVESVLYDEFGWVPNATDTKRKRDRLRK